MQLRLDRGLVAARNNSIFHRTFLAARSSTIAATVSIEAYPCDRRNRSVEPEKWRGTVKLSGESQHSGASSLPALAGTRGRKNGGAYERHCATGGRKPERFRAFVTRARRAEPIDLATFPSGGELTSLPRLHQPACIPTI